MQLATIPNQTDLEKFENDLKQESNKWGQQSYGPYSYWIGATIPDIEFDQDISHIILQEKMDP